MISSLFIENFQSHENTVISFDKGVNVIVGHSDCGKSAIIRAARWCIYNSPGGEAFRSKWGGDTSVTITLDGQVSVTRTKGKKNTYELSTKDKPFTAFGNKVPEEIENALNFTNLNLQAQIDRPFLLQDSPGEVARHFNKIAHIDKINQSLKYVDGEMRKLKTRQGQATEDLEKFKEELQAFVILDDLEVKLEKLEKQHAKAESLQSEISELFQLIKKIEVITSEIEKLPQIEHVESDVNEALNLVEKKEAKGEEIIKLNARILNLITANNKCEEFNTLLKFDKEVEQCLELSDTLKTKDTEITELAGLIEDIEFNKLHNSIDKQLKKAEAEYIANMPDICPLCDTDLSKRNEKNKN